MFHVAPLLPYNEEDVQQLERKRHLGNDVVLIFFLEEGAEIDVSLINSQFNHVFCLVQKCTDADGNTQYRFGIVLVVSVDCGDREMSNHTTNFPFFHRVMFAYKKEVLPFTPFLPKNWCIPKNAQGKEFLMTKRLSLLVLLLFKCISLFILFSHSYQRRAGCPSCPSVFDEI